MPNFTASGWIQRIDDVRARRDDHLFAVHRDALRRAKGKLLPGIGGTFEFPCHLPIADAQRGDVLLLAPVAGENEFAIHNDRRAASAVLRLVIQLPILPDLLAIQIQTSGALVAEVNIEFPLMENGRGTGVAVLLVNASGGLLTGLIKHHDVPQRLAGGGVEANCGQLAVGFWVGFLAIPDDLGGGEIEFPGDEDR